MDKTLPGLVGIFVSGGFGSRGIAGIIVDIQYHLECKSRPNKAYPLFKGFIGAAFEQTMGGKL